MGLETAAIIGGTALLGGLAGSQKKVENTTGTNQGTQTQQTTFAPATGDELALRQQAMDNYNRQAQLTGQLENFYPADQYQQMAQLQGGRILNGEAFGLTPEEQQQIMNIRNLSVQQGTADVNQLLDQRFRQLGGEAGARGLRGQALSELQGRQLAAGAQQLGSITNQANLVAAQQAMQAPLNRINAQSGFIQGGLNYADQLRQNAIANRASLQNPALLARLQQERQAQGVTVGSNQGTTSGQQSGGGGFGGFLGGLAGGAAGGVGLANGIAQTGYYNGLSDRLGF